MKKTTRPNVQTDNLPPHALEMERGVLGCALIAPNEVMAQCQQAGLTAEWFYDLRHQLVYHNLERLFATGTPIDVLSLLTRLKDAGVLEQIGGIPYLDQMQDAVPSAANLSYYLDIVREKWIARKSQAVLTEAATRLANTAVTDAALSDLLRDVEKLADQSVPKQAHLAKAFMPAVIDGIEDYHRGHAQMRGIPTGIEYVDKQWCGMGGLNSKMIIIAARPSTGKTALVLDIAQHVACDAHWFKPLYNADFTRQRDEKGLPIAVAMKKTPVGIFSFEMSGLALTDRLVYQRARADKQRWRNGYATDADLLPITKASVEVSAAPIFIDDVPCTVEQLVAKARQLHRQHGIELFVVDYLQLIYSQKDFRGDRVQELAYISRLLTLTAKSLNVPFIVVAQMNRDAEKEPNRKPRLSDLKDSGAIEQDADIVAFLYEPKLREQKEENWDKQLMENWPNADKTRVDWSRAPRRINLLTAKYRNGPTGDAELLFHKSCMHFEDYTLWQKQKGYLPTAAGEPKQDRLIDAEDVPENPPEEPL